jgi:hypothetical protein
VACDNKLVEEIGVKSKYEMYNIVQILQGTITVECREGIVMADRRRMEGVIGRYGRSGLRLNGRRSYFSHENRKR